MADSTIVILLFSGREEVSLRQNNNIIDEGIIRSFMSFWVSTVVLVKRKA